MAEQEQYVVSGFAFSDMEQAKAASAELKRIEVLNKNIDYKNIASVAMVYDKARENQVFKTPLGISYMKQLQDCLVKAHYEGIEEKPVVISKALQSPESDEQQKLLQQREEVFKSKLDLQKDKEKELRGRFRIAILCNAFLVLLVILLFVISQTGKTPTVLNYKTKIINQYTQWEQELEEREQTIIEKEKELGIEE